MAPLPVTRVVLYKHGVGYFERRAAVDGDATLALTFKQAEVSDVLKSLTVLDRDGGHVASVSYDSTKPLEQLLAEVALSIPDQNSLVGLLPQLKGAEVAVTTTDGGRVVGALLGVDAVDRETPSGIVKAVLASLLTAAGELRSFDLHALRGLELLDPALRRDLEYYLRIQLSAKKKDARTFTFFAQGQGKRVIQLSYILEAPVWKATYRIILGEEDRPPTLQGWAVVDNTQDEDWTDVELSLVAGLPVSFVHDLYTPRFVRRPVVEVRQTTGVLPPEVESGMRLVDDAPRPVARGTSIDLDAEIDVAALEGSGVKSVRGDVFMGLARSAVSSTPTQVRERQLGDLFEYQIEHPVTIKRNQSALVPIVLRPFEGRPVLLHNKSTRAGNPMRAVEFKNTTGLTLEGGPVTVLEGGSYVGEAMLDTLKPGEERLVPYAVELSVKVLDNVDSHRDRVQRVVVREGWLRLFTLHVEKTTYTFTSHADAEQTLYLDHPRPGAEWTLHDTPEPREVTEHYWRFRFALPAKKTTAFAVTQRYLVQQQESLHHLNAGKLGLWLEQRYLDRRTEEVLRQALGLQLRAGELEQRRSALQEERETILLDQQRLRENLQALGDRATEKELRERIVRTLNGQEDRLEQIAAESKSCTAEREQVTAQVRTLLGALEYESSAQA